MKNKSNIYINDNGLHIVFDRFSNLLLYPFQFIGHFGFSKYITFTVYLDVSYIYISRKLKTNFNLGLRVVLIF
jgi:hypothetical protein